MFVSYFHWFQSLVEIIFFQSKTFSFYKYFYATNCNIEKNIRVFVALKLTQIIGLLVHIGLFLTHPLTPLKRGTTDYSLINATVWQAIIPAVSVRNRVLPNNTGW